MSDIGENVFWLRVWRIVATAACVLGITAAVCQFRERTALERLVKEGADPMRAACALGVYTRGIAICAILATSAKETK